MDFKKNVLLLLLLFFIALHAQSYEEYEILWQQTESESEAAEKLKKEIIEKFPASKLSFQLCRADFYEQLYPVWQNDSLKVTIITNL
ncbi:MAG: hypothetical protein SVM86_05790, partial [Candidatus Cloacimonadota bacterium]|nr:hypothetical protein [Candidatus Cloacimonadota bacterium]